MREVDFKKVRFISSKIKKLKSNLKKEFVLLTSYKKDAIKEYEFLNEDKYFSKLARNDILNVSNKRHKNIDFVYKDYNKLLYCYFCAEDYVSKCDNLIKKIDRETLKILENVSPAKNILKWFFTSKEKKKNAFNYYDELSLINVENYEKEFDDFYREFHTKKNQKIDLNNYFINNKEKCLNLIKTQITDNGRLDIIKALFDDIAIIDRKILKISDISNDLIDKIKESIDHYLGSKVLNFLREVPIEEISREKKGIRIKALLDAGITTMADAYTKSHYRLSLINGISEDSAYTIKKIAEKFGEEAKKDVRIKLSYDNKDVESSKLVNSIFAYKKVADFLKILNEYKFENYDDALNKMKNLKSGIFWLFYSDEQKIEYINSYETLKKIGKSEYKSKCNEFLNSAKEYLNLEFDAEVWEDFKENSIEYYNIIEKIKPGALEGNKVDYDLPEELLREIEEECLFPDGLLCSLRRYQELGVKYILHQEKVLLGDEMGLGKTIQAIATMVSLKNTGAKHFMVVCPASVITNWCREIGKHSRLTYFKCHGSNKKNAIKAWINNGGVIVTTYESLNSIELIPSFKFSQLIVDEAHYIKNRGAKRTNKVIEISNYAERILFMTGTPIENNVDEMISLIDILRPDIARSLVNYAFMPYANSFKKIIAPVYFRRKREDVLQELPELIEKEEWCTMNNVELEAYEKILDDGGNIFMSIRRVSWNVDDICKSSKMNRLKEIVEEAKIDNRKVIVFSYFLDTIKKIHEHLGYKVCLNPITGSLNPRRRQEIIDEFSDSPAGSVLCAQIQSGGTGLNIQSGSVVIICEPQLKPSIENQAISRAYRMGQTRNVLVFRLLCEDSIDERIIELLRDKQLQFDTFADKSIAAQNIEIDEKRFGELIKEEIDRINKKRELAKTNEQNNLDSDKLKINNYYRDPVSVTKRIKEVYQPTGGFINPKSMDVQIFNSSTDLNEKENIFPTLIGLCVDYLTRYLLTNNVDEAFKISLMGAKNLYKTDFAEKLLSNISGLDDISIISALKLVGFDCAYRASVSVYKPIEEINPDKDTIFNIREMVNRALNFFKCEKSVIETGFEFDGGYTNIICAGDGDFLTEDTIWDFKVSKNEPKKEETLQILIYYLMGLHSNNSSFKDVKYIGIFNPRLNKSYKISIDNIDDNYISKIEKEVIGY